MTAVSGERSPADRDAWRDRAAYRAYSITDPDEITAWVAGGWTAPRADGWRAEGVSSARACVLRGEGIRTASMLAGHHAGHNTSSIAR